MNGWMNGTSWFWMAVMAPLWIAAIGAVVYAAVRLANRGPEKPR